MMIPMMLSRFGLSAQKSHSSPGSPEFCSISDDCHWADVRVVTTNVGQALQRAMHGIEKANPETLYGIFGDAQRGDLWHVLPDTEAPWVADGERSGGCRDHTSRPRVSGQ
jgi:hypothetical protein